MHCGNVSPCYQEFLTHWIFSHVKYFLTLFLCSAQVHRGEECPGALDLHRGHRRQYLPRFHFSGGAHRLLLLLQDSEVQRSAALRDFQVFKQRYNVLLWSGLQNIKCLFLKTVLVLSFFLFSVATLFFLTPLRFKHMVYISLYFLLNISICYWLQWHFNRYCSLLVFFFSEPILSAVKSKLPFRSHKRKSQGTARSSESYHKIADSDQSYKPEVEVSDIMQDRTDSASTLVIGQDPKRIAENQV